MMEWNGAGVELAWDEPLERTNHVADHIFICLIKNLLSKHNLSGNLRIIGDGGLDVLPGSGNSLDRVKANVDVVVRDDVDRYTFHLIIFVFALESLWNWSQQQNSF